VLRPVRVTQESFHPIDCTDNQTDSDEETYTKLGAWQSSALARPARKIANANKALVICVDYRRHLANMIKPNCVAKRSV